MASPNQEYTMRIESFRRAVLVAACLAGPALAQNAQPDDKAQLKVAVEQPDADAKAEPNLIPEITLTGIPFSDVVNYLRDVDPAFQAVVSYAPGVDSSEPVIQDLRLKKVSADSVVEVMAAAYPQLRVAKDETARIWIIHVEPDPRQRRRDEGGGGEEGDKGKTYTNVYRLREIVDEMIDVAPNGNAKEDARKNALDSVLSLLQAAIETQGEAKSPAAIKVHPATETLVFKGTSDQANLIDQALANLAPPKEVQQQRSNRTIQNLEGEVENLQLQLQTMQTQMGVLLRGTSPAPTTAPASPAPATPKQ
jgi:hypothetical protein